MSIVGEDTKPDCGVEMPKLKFPSSPLLTKELFLLHKLVFPSESFICGKNKQTNK